MWPVDFGWSAYLVVEPGLQLRPTNADPAAGTTDTTYSAAHDGLRGGDHVGGTKYVTQCVPRTRLVLHLLPLVGGDAASIKYSKSI